MFVCKQNLLIKTISKHNLILKTIGKQSNENDKKLSKDML